MLLSLAGAPSRVVSLDYMLSRIGTEPVRGALLEFAMAGTGCETISQPGFYNFCQLREESWDAFVQGVQKEYGGFEGFVTNRLGISAEDLASIKSNLIQDTPHEHTSL